MTASIAVVLALVLAQDAAPVREGQEPGGEPSKVTEQLPEAIGLIRSGQAGEALRKLKGLDKESGGTCAECVLAMAVAHRRLRDEKAALAAARRVVGMTQDAALLMQAYEMIGERLAIGNYKKADAKTKARFEEADAAFARILELTSGAGPGPAQEFRNNALGSRVALLLKLGRRAEAEALAAPLLETAPESETAKRVENLLTNPRCLDEPCAPSFAFTTATGETRTLEDLRGKVVVLAFWATWLPDDVEWEMAGAARSLNDRFGKELFVLIGVNSEDPKQMEQAVARHRMSWPQIWDQGGRLAKRYEVQAMPSDILIDHEGVIVGRTRGHREGEVEALGRSVRSAIDAAKKAAARQQAP